MVPSLCPTDILNYFWLHPEHHPQASSRRLCSRPIRIKFTTKAWDAIFEAQDVARRFKHQYMEVEHVIIALLDQEEDGLAHKIFRKRPSLILI